jgi:intracellular sulfur oxidation DsrE/DsrF family protein
MVRAQSSSSPKPYKVVFDLTTDDPQDQAAVLRWLREVASVNPQNEMEVVMYGRGLALVVSGRSTLGDEVKQAIGRPHVSFKVCEIAMRNQKLEKEPVAAERRRPCRTASAKSWRDRRQGGATSRPWPTEYGSAVPICAFLPAPRGSFGRPMTRLGSGLRLHRRAQRLLGQPAFSPLGYRGALRYLTRALHLLLRDSRVPTVSRGGHRCA